MVNKTEANKKSGAKLKRHSYHLRFTDGQYQRLMEMTKDGQTMSAIINDGIDCEWSYYQTLSTLMTYLQQHSKIDESIADFKMEHFKNHPELLEKYVKTETIQRHNQLLENHNQKLVDLIAGQETLAYLIKRIGNNINQLARVANAGGNVPREELRKFTQAVINLSNQLDSRKEDP